MRGFRSPTPCACFLYAQKVGKKAPGELPRPPGIALRARLHLGFYLRSDGPGLILPAVPTLRLPPAGPSFGVPPNDWPGDASAALLRSDSERSPLLTLPL